ncbi:MAG: GNAT family N-acetyltransferase [Myroides sp.]|jgi:RimJ/RimL family protein N-acetyltransferase|nr:GNAT family N-acetyltransferase [Myroides sp.]
MSLPTLTTTLKNDTQITIRPATRNGSAALLTLIKEYLDNSEYIPINAKDFTKTPQDIADWIKQLNTSANSLMLVAEFQGELIGNLDLTGHHRSTMFHTAVLGMGIVMNWRNTGVGTVLLKTALEWAKNSPLEIISLDVYTENKSGIALYQKLGFKEVGVIPDFIKDNDR